MEAIAISPRKRNAGDPRAVRVRVPDFRTTRRESVRGAPAPLRPGYGLWGWRAEAGPLRRRGYDVRTEEGLTQSRGERRGKAGL
jgi:hypothetical protein